jgi:hypothetical protein
VSPGGLAAAAAGAAKAGVRIDAVRKTFQDFRVTHYEDIVDTSDWGKNQARLGRIVAVKE